jgi:hypothetical protein
VRAAYFPMPLGIEAPVTIASFPSNDTVTSLYFPSQSLTCQNKYVPAS